MDLQLRAMNCCNRGHIPMAGWWVVICAFCSCAGWGLSAVHQLNARGYAVALGIGMAGLMFWKWRSGRAGKNFKLHPPSSKHYGETRRNSKLQAPKGELGSAGLLSPALSSQGGEGEVTASSLVS